MHLQLPPRIFSTQRARVRRMWAGAMAFVLLAGFASLAAAEGIVPLGVRESGPYGFEAPCNYGEVLSGFFMINDGFNFIDASPQCVKASNPSLKIHAVPERWYSDATGRHAEQWPVENPSCPDYAPVVLSIRVATLVNSQSEIKSFRFQGLETFCGMGESHQEYAGGRVSTLGGGDWQRGSGTQFCPAGQVAVGIHGSFQGAYGLKEIGLLCGDPKTGYDNKLVLSPDAPRIDTGTAANHAVLSPPVFDSRATVVKQPMASGFSRLGRVTMPAPVTPSSVTPSSQAVLPAQQPPPVAQPPAQPGHAFTPPTFDDGAQLWACVNAVQGKNKGIACPGLKAGKAYCLRHGFSGALQARADGAPELMVTAAKPGIPVRANNGDVCTANDCVVIAELHCAP